VPRSRFAPVKKCRDLLALWSDCYVLSDDYLVIQNPERTAGTLIVKLDDRYYKKIDQLRARFPRGTPSLVECQSLEVKGDVQFGQNVVVRGKIVVSNHSDNQVVIPDGSLIEKDLVFT
jgi:UTP--glucose-1-phosphate uridylyltransferase